MIDYFIQEVSFLSFTAPNIYWNLKTILHTDNFHVRGWEMSNTQRVVAVSQTYQNFKISETATSSELSEMPNSTNWNTEFDHNCILSSGSKMCINKAIAMLNKMIFQRNFKHPLNNIYILFEYCRKGNVYIYRRGSFNFPTLSYFQSIHHCIWFQTDSRELNKIKLNKRSMSLKDAYPYLRYSVTWK